MTGRSRNLKDGILFSSKERTISCEMITYIEILPDYFMIMKRQDILENSKLTTLCNSITGGPDYVHMLKTMCTDAVLVNNLKSTDLHPDPLIFLPKGLSRHGHLRIAQWTSLRTYHQSTGLILFWSW